MLILLDLLDPKPKTKLTVIKKVDAITDEAMTWPLCFKYFILNINLVNFIQNKSEKKLYLCNYSIQISFFYYKELSNLKTCKYRPYFNFLHTVKNKCLPVLNDVLDLYQNMRKFNCSKLSSWLWSSPSSPIMNRSVNVKNNNLSSSKTEYNFTDNISYTINKNKKHSNSPK